MTLLISYAIRQMCIFTYSGANIITYPTKEILSKIAFFKKAWQTLKVMPYPWTSSS